MVLPLPDPNDLEDLRREEVRRSWLHGIGTVVAAIAAYVNGLGGALGGVFYVQSNPGATLPAIVGVLVLVALPVGALLYIRRLSTRAIREHRGQALELLGFPPQTWLTYAVRLTVVLALIFIVIGLQRSAEPRLGWALLIGAMALAGFGRRWNWDSRFPLWAALAMLGWGAVAVPAFWWVAGHVHPDNMWAVMIGVLLSAPMVVPIGLLRSRLKAWALDPPTTGIGVWLQPLVVFLVPADLAEIDLAHGDFEAARDRVEPIFRRGMRRRPLEPAFVVFARALDGQADDRARDLWVLAARLFPKSPAVFKGLAEKVDDPELAVDYAVFAEANAARSNRVDEAPYRELRERLQQQLKER